MVKKKGDVVPDVLEEVVKQSAPKENYRYKVVHWTMFNGSGMFNVANSIMKAERGIGIDARLASFDMKEIDESVMDADVHVVHTHIPDHVRQKLPKKAKLVWVGHGSVEHVFNTSIENGVHQGYGAGDSWMLCQYWLQHADALVTFWPRQRALWQSLCDKNTIVEYVKMGVDLDFWKPVPSAGKYLGEPSLFTAENCHYIKSPLDLFLLWPWVAESFPNARLHAIYLPHDQHRWFFPLVNRNGAAYKSVISSLILPPEGLRNAFCSTDYFIGLVRYGEANRLCIEANASGAKTISYKSNPYTDYWVDEGDQRIIARQLTDILNGEVEPRKKHKVPDISETAQMMSAIYERILS
jgi:hypothetical protein